MTGNGWEIQVSSPIGGMRRERTEAFLAEQGLRLEDDTQHTVNLVDADRQVLATGSLRGDTLLCLAVHPGRQGEGLAARVVGELVKLAAREGRFHLFAYTKPENKQILGGVGFYEVARTADSLLMENRRDGARRYAQTLAAEGNPPVGAVVVNCNPFTEGHRYLIETAAATCGLLYVLVVSEDRSRFPAPLRLRLVREGTAHLPGVVFRPTGRYLISSNTFPTYFIKERAQGGEIGGELDLRVFGEHFVPALGITRRFVGTEPHCAVTRAYNRAMKDILPGYGVEVVEIERMEQAGGAVSASRVRALLARGELEAVRPLVPPATYAFLCSQEGAAVMQALREDNHGNFV